MTMETMTDDNVNSSLTHGAYLEKLQKATNIEPTSSKIKTKQILQLLNYLEQESHNNNSNNNNKEDGVLLDLISGDAIICIAAAKLGIVRNAIAINPRSSSKVVAHSEGVFGKSCEFYTVEDLLESSSRPSLLLDNPHLLSEKMKSATIILCCAPPVLLRRLVPLVAALINDHDDKVAVTMVHHFPPEQCIDGQVQDVTDTDIRVYHKIACNTILEENTEKKQSVQVPMDQWVPPPPEPCDPDEIDKDFARGSIRYAMPTGTADKPFGSSLREY